MKIWIRRCAVTLLLVGVVAGLPALTGCNTQKKRDDANRAKPGFNEKAGKDPMSIKLDNLPANQGGETPQQ